MATSHPPARVRALLAPALLLTLALSCKDDDGPGSGTRGFTGRLAAFFSPDTIQPGEFTTLTINVPQRTSNEAFRVLVDYVGSGVVDTLLVAGQSAGALTGQLAIPNGSPDGTLALVATIPGTSFRDTATLTVRDRRLPDVSGYVEQRGLGALGTMDAPDYHVVAGRTATVHVSAIDNGIRRWAGYELGAPFNRRDSSTAGGQASFPLPVPDALAGSSAVLRIFGTDASGNRAERTLGVLRVHRHVDRDAGVASLDAPVRDVALDAARNRAYLSQPTRGRVAVLSLADMRWLAPIPMPLPPAGLDLSVGGDSLVVALERSAYLAVVDLRGATPTVDTLRLRFAPDAASAGAATPADMVPWADRVRVDGGGRAVVTLAQPEGAGTRSNDRIVTVELATGAQQVTYRGSALPALQLARSGNRQLTVIAGAGLGALLYPSGQPVIDQLGTTLPEIANRSSFSADTRATGWLLGADLLNTAMQPQRPRLAVRSLALLRTALSPDGTRAFSSTRLPCFPALSPSCGQDFAAPAYLRLRAVDGALEEVVNLPELPDQLVALADGARMLAVGPTRVVLLDLTDAGARTASGDTPPVAPLRAATTTAPLAAPTPRVRWAAPR